MSNTAITTQLEGHVLIPPVIRFLQSSPKKLLIGGKWISAKSCKTFETVNPANEEVLALVVEGDKVDVDETVKAARKAFEDGRWARIGPLVSKEQFQRVVNYVEIGRREGARLAAAVWRF